MPMGVQCIKSVVCWYRKNDMSDIFLENSKDLQTFFIFKLK